MTFTIVTLPQSFIKLAAESWGLKILNLESFTSPLLKVTTSVKIKWTHFYITYRPCNYYTNKL